MFNLEDVLAVDNLDPIQKYLYFIGRYNKIEVGRSESLSECNLSKLCEISLIALYLIDTILKSRFRVKYNFYVQNDRSIKDLIENIVNNFLAEQFNKAIFILDETKLVYRFTCAKKFSIKDTKIKQIRINSWGLEYITQFDILNKYEPEVNRLHKKILRYYLKNENNYRQLMKYLLMDVRADKINEKLIQINKNLKIKLLS